MGLIHRLPLLCAFVASGAFALVYEVTWARMLYPVFGMHLAAISTVIATFLGGLGLGAALFGPVVDRARMPFRLYGWLEIGIGACAFVLPTLTRSLTPVYAALSPLDAPAGVDHVVRVLGVFLLLGAPCLLMGATFPAFAKGYLRSDPRMSRDLGVLYALNTVGGAVGCLSAGTVLMQAPVSRVVHATAIGNLVIGLLFVAFGSRLAGADRSMPAPPRGDGSPLAAGRPMNPTVILAITLLVGFLSLSFEILWTRALIPVIGATYTSFALILSSMLIGITLGTALYRIRLHRSEPSTLLRVLLSLLLLVSVASFLGVFQLAKLLPAIEAVVSTHGRFLPPLAPRFLLCFLAFLPSSMVFGAIFPLCLSAYTRAIAHAGTDVGRVYAFNTVGSVAGVLMTGLLIIGWLGSSGTLIFLLLLNLAAIGISLERTEASRGAWRLASASLGIVAIALLLGFPRDVFFAHQRAELERQLPNVSEIVFQAEDTDSMTTIAELDASFQRVGESGVERARHRWTLHSNRSYVGGTRIYLWNIVGGYLAGILPPTPQKVLVVGFGSGRQVATMASLPHIERIDVVELSGLNFSAASHYYIDSDALFDDPRIRLYEGDGRNHLLRTREAYDVIIVDVGGLTPNSSTFFYTREFLALCRERLRPGGYLFTWLSAASFLEPQGWSYQATFRSVFPNASVWYGSREASSFAWPWIVGVKGSPRVDDGTLRQRWDALTPRQRSELRISGVDSLEDLLSLYAASLDPALVEPEETARILTDDHPFHDPGGRSKGGKASAQLAWLARMDSGFRQFVDAEAVLPVVNRTDASTRAAAASHAEFTQVVSRRMFPILMNSLRNGLETRGDAAATLERYARFRAPSDRATSEPKRNRGSPVLTALRALSNRPPAQEQSASGLP